MVSEERSERMDGDMCMNEHRDLGRPEGSEKGGGWRKASGWRIEN